MGYLNYCSVIWGLYTCKGHGDRAMIGGGGRGYRCFGRQLLALRSGISCARSVSHNSLGTTQLALDLLAGPAGGFNGSRLELSVGLGLLDHSSNPFLTESINQFAIGVCISKVAVYVSLVQRNRVMDDLPNNAHRSSHQ